MRIALIAPPWLPVPPPAYGGIEAAVDLLARGLADAGHEVHLHASGDSTCPVARSWTFRTAETERMGRSLEELRHVLDGYRRLDGYDVIHDHTLVGPMLGAARRHSTVVTTAHAPIRGSYEPVYRAISGRVPIIAISRSQVVPHVPVAGVIHHGIDLEAFLPGSGDGGYLLFLGRMDPTKGVEDAIGVARAAGVPLRIAAKMRLPWERAYYRDRIVPQLGPGVEYVGEPTMAERLVLLQGALALLNPIRWEEPFGLVMIEALACGTPVIAHRRGAAPEIVDDGVTGALTSGGPEMVAAVERVAALDRRACRAAAVARFSTGRMVQQHIELYERLRERRHADRPAARRRQRRAARPARPGTPVPSAPLAGGPGAQAWPC